MQLDNVIHDKFRHRAYESNLNRTKLSSDEHYLPPNSYQFTINSVKRPEQKRYRYGQRKCQGRENEILDTPDQRSLLHIFRVGADPVVHERDGVVRNLNKLGKLHKRMHL